MSRLSRHSLALVSLVVIFLCVNISASLLLREARLDLTENKLFTLSQGTHTILDQVEEPITLTFYYSQSLAADYPAQRAYAQRVRDLLQEMVGGSGGKLNLKIIDPAPFSETEEVAVSLGLVGTPVAEGDLFYFGLVGNNLVDDTEVIPVFAKEREQYLEYDLARLIDNLNTPVKPVVGVISNLPLDTGAGGLLAAMRGESQPFLIYAELTDRFEVEFVDPKSNVIASRIEVLLIAHPRDLSVTQLYAIDQFVMRGGRVIAFVDPYSEVSLTAGPKGEPLQGYTEQSSLDQLFTSWGIQVPKNVILADRQRAQRVATGRDARRQLVDYVLWMGLTPSEFNEADVVTGNIDLLNVGSTGIILPRENATTTVTPLVTSSADAMLLPRDIVVAGPVPDNLLRDFIADEKRHAISVRIEGSIETAFPDGPPTETEGQQSTGTKNKPLNQDDHLTRNDGANIIVFADSDFFDDRFWVSEQNYMGQRFGVPIADNGKFLLNAVENLMGSDALISLRGREKSTRIFDRVDRLRKQAEAEYLAEERALSERIESAQAELTRIQNTVTANEDSQVVVMQYRQELLAARKALRAVQANLRRDIETLGGIVRWLNIALMPVIITILSLLVMAGRRRRRAQTQRSGGFRMVDTNTPRDRSNVEPSDV